MATTHTVTIAGMVFHPEPMRIVLGDSIVWANLDNLPHTATFDFGSTGQIAAGATSQPIRFEKASGQSGFLYFCEVHPEMAGTVHVAPAEILRYAGSALGSRSANSAAQGDVVDEYPTEVWQYISKQVAAVWVYDMADDFRKAELVHGDADSQRVKDAWERIEQWWLAGPGGGQRIRDLNGTIDPARLLVQSADVLETLGRKVRTEYLALGRLIFRHPHPDRPDDTLEPGEMFSGQSSDPFGKAITVNFIPKPIQEAYQDHQDFAGAAFRIEILQDAAEPVPDTLKDAYKARRAKMSVLHYKLLAYHQVKGLQTFFGQPDFDSDKFDQGLWRMTMRGEWDSPTFVGWHWLKWIQGYLFALENGAVIDLVIDV